MDQRPWIPAALGVLTIVAVGVAWLTLSAPERGVVLRAGSSPLNAPVTQLMPVERLAADRIAGPEDLAIEPSSDLLAGTADGRIVRYRLADGRVEEVARTGGHPLGLTLVDGDLNPRNSGEEVDQGLKSEGCSWGSSGRMSCA